MVFWEKFRKKRIDIPTGKDLITEYDGREIIIQDRSKNIEESKIKQIKIAILIFFKTNIIAKKFPKITFIIESHEKEERTEWADTTEIVQKKVIVHLNAFAIVKAKQIPYIGGHIAHELTHIMHYHISDGIKKREKYWTKTIKALHEHFLELIEKEPDIKDIRENLLLFIHALPVEGLAEYFRYLSIGKIFFKKREFRKYYKEAKRETKRVKKLWIKYLVAKETNRLKSIEKSKNIFMDRLWRLSYPAGLHMVYTLIYTNHINDPVTIAKLSSHKFIKEYETAMKIKGLPPIVSLTSGDGILDYKRMLAEWWAVVKK